jgi:hypothetical protein
LEKYFIYDWDIYISSEREWSEDPKGIKEVVGD